MPEPTADHQRDESLRKKIGRRIFSALFLVAGVSHFVFIDAFVKIMPPYIPYAHAMVLISGVFEIALGAMLLNRRTSRLAAWGLIALLVAVFPANIYMYQHANAFSIPQMVLLARLPLQALLILWAYVYTRPGFRDRVTKNVGMRSATTESGAMSS